MVGVAIFAAGLLVGYIAGRCYWRVRSFCGHVYWHRKLGICWRYVPTGYRENRGGTISDFCQRCGHPAGYHHNLK